MRPLNNLIFSVLLCCFGDLCPAATLDLNYTLFNGPSDRNPSTTLKLDGISGNNILGSYTTTTFQNYAFVYDGSNYTLFNGPSDRNPSTALNLYGISGNNILGSYTTISFETSGFLGNSSQIVPEPGALDLSVIGVLGMCVMIYMRSRFGKASVALLTTSND